MGSGRGPCSSRSSASRARPWRPASLPRPAPRPSLPVRPRAPVPGRRASLARTARGRTSTHARRKDQEHTRGAAPRRHAQHMPHAAPHTPRALLHCRADAANFGPGPSRGACALMRQRHSGAVLGGAHGLRAGGVRRGAVVSLAMAAGRTETVIDRVDEWLRRQTFGGMVDRQELKNLLKDLVSDDAYWQRQVSLSVVPFPLRSLPLPPPFSHSLFPTPSAVHVRACVRRVCTDFVCVCACV